MNWSCRSAGPCARFSTASGCHVSPDEIRQERHQRETFARGEFRESIVGVDLQIAETIDDRHPFRTDMSELRGVLLERRVTVGIAVGVKGEPHFVVGKFLVRMRRRRRLGDRFLRRMSRQSEFFPERFAPPACPAGFFFCNDLSWPFNCRSENGSCSCGATKSVCTKRTVARKQRSR